MPSSTHTPNSLTETLRKMTSWRSCDRVRGGLRFAIFAVLVIGNASLFFGNLFAEPIQVTAPTPPPPPELRVRSFTVFTDYGEGNAIASSLRNSPPKLYKFDRASLRDVLRFLADDAGIPFISMQERAPAATGGTSTAVPIDDVLVTFTMRASPFLVLESIAKANDVALVYESGVWFIRPYNERELMGRIYRLKYTPQERVVFNDNSSGGCGTVSQSNSNVGGQTSATIPNLQTQQSQSVFKVEEPALVKEIKGMLKIPSRGISGRVAPLEASVGDFPPLPSNLGVNPAGANLTGAQAETNAEPTVTFNSDTNTIYIVATRQQHQWVEGFLAAADRPQALIGIEVKFFETSKNPTKDLGINWANTFGGDGYHIRMGAEGQGTATIGSSVNNQRDRGFNNNQQDITTRSSAGNSFNSTTTSILNDIYSSVQNYNSGLGGGFTAWLTPQQVDFAIQAFMTDSDTTLTQYPRVLTVNNREVAISNAVNRPILAGSTQTSPGGGSSISTSQVQYLPIGTQVNILPKTMPDGSVFMNVAITISSRGGDIDLPAGVGGASSSYPVTISRIYQAALQVDSGYTLAVGGLDAATDDKTSNGIPGLKSIPGLGALFRSKGRSQDRRNLIVFITPSIINDRRASSGISEEPQSILPIRPGDPTPPAFAADGRLVGGYTSLDAAIEWLKFQNRFFEQVIREGRVSKDTIAQLEGVIRTAEMVVAEVEFLAAQNPARADQFSAKGDKAQEILDTLYDTLKKTKKNSF